MTVEKDAKNVKRFADIHEGDLFRVDCAEYGKTLFMKCYPQDGEYNVIDMEHGCKFRISDGETPVEVV